MKSKIMTILEQLFSDGDIFIGMEERHSIRKAHTGLFSLIRSCVPKKKLPVSEISKIHKESNLITFGFNSACDIMEKKMEGL